MTKCAPDSLSSRMPSESNELHSHSFKRTSAWLLPSLAAAVLCSVSLPGLAATAPDLASVSSFAIVSETFSNVSAGTSITGDVCYTTGPAVTPAISGITETPCAPQRGIDQNAALAHLNAQSCEPLGAAVTLNEVSIDGGPPGEFPPGCYSSTGAMTITEGTTVTLSGDGVYIFRPDGALDAASNASVVAAEGACENDVYWTPTGATTLGASAQFVGTIFHGHADGLSITMGDSVSLTGRALGYGSTVTSDNVNISVPACEAIPPIDPGISLTKTITGGDPYAAEGDIITYLLVAENTGEVTLTDVTISDPDVTLSNCEPIQGSTLEPGDMLSCDASYTVVEADVEAGSFTNIAIVEGFDPDDQMVHASDWATAFTTATPIISLTKTITGGDPYSAEGDSISYFLVAENTGNVTLTDVTISDPDVILSNCEPAQGSTLEPNDMMSCDATYTVLEADVDAGSFTNTAMVVGFDPEDQMVDATDSATANAATTVVAPFAVPAMSAWSIMLMAGLLALFGFAFFRR